MEKWCAVISSYLVRNHDSPSLRRESIGGKRNIVVDVGVVDVDLRQGIARKQRTAPSAVCNICCAIARHTVSQRDPTSLFNSAFNTTYH
jgi:hypothetical protein